MDTQAPPNTGARLTPQAIEALIARRLDALGHRPDLLDQQAVAALVADAAGSGRRLRSSLAATLFLASTEDAPQIDASLVHRALTPVPSAPKLPGPEARAALSRRARATPFRPVRLTGVPPAEGVAPRPRRFRASRLYLLAGCTALAVALASLILRPPPGQAPSAQTTAPQQIVVLQSAAPTPGPASPANARTPEAASTPIQTGGGPPAPNAQPGATGPGNVASPTRAPALPQPAAATPGAITFDAPTPGTRTPDSPLPDSPTPDSPTPDSHNPDSATADTPTRDAPTPDTPTRDTANLTPPAAPVPAAGTPAPTSPVNTASPAQPALPPLPPVVAVRTPPVPPSSRPTDTDHAPPLPAAAPAAIVLLYPARDPRALSRLDPIALSLQKAGLKDIRAKPVHAPPPRRVISYFYAEDRPLADTIAKVLATSTWPHLNGNSLQPSLVLAPPGITVRSPGTIEVQLP